MENDSSFSFEDINGESDPRIKLFTSESEKIARGISEMVLE